VNRGFKPIVLERRKIAGAHGSSHGPSRITRSVYADPVYVHIMQRLHRDHWPQMESLLGLQLLFKTDGLFFGHGDLWNKYQRAVLSQGVDVEQLDVQEGRRRFPQFQLKTAESVLHDHTAAVIAADRVLCGLRDWLIQNGAEIREDTRLLQLEPRSDSVSLMTSGGSFDADSVVLTVGSWISDLVPELAENVTVIWQTVGYYDLGPGYDMRPPNFPVWVAIGGDIDEVYYGLPEFDRPGVKVGYHQTTASFSDDPDLEGYPEASLDDLNWCKVDEFTSKNWTRLSYERCLYTVAPNEDYVIGLHPKQPRIVIGSACSGHGFKFGPWTGEVLADFALHGGTNDADYLANESKFSPNKFWDDAMESVT